jgi:hypothetical protein
MTDIDQVRDAITELVNVLSSRIPPNVVAGDNSSGLHQLAKKWSQVHQLEGNALTEAGAIDIFERVASLLQAVKDSVAPILAVLSSSGGTHHDNIKNQIADTLRIYAENIAAEEEELTLLEKALELKQQEEPLLKHFLNQIASSQSVGEGAFGVVYQVYCVTHTANHEFFALKIVREPSPPTANVESSECDALKMLTHPNIVRFFLHCARPTTFVLAWVDGGNLAQHLQTSVNPLSHDEVTEVLKQLASALSYMHGKGVLHRDLKLDNVMLTGNFARHNIKVVDLGCACILNAADAYCRQFAGYEGNASFEKVYRLPFDGRDDVFAVGRIALALLLRKPYETGNYKIKKMCV